MVRRLTDPDLDDADRTMLRHIAEHQWSVTLVPAEGNCPGWAFTTGLYLEFEAPEIVVVGLPQEAAHWLLNEMGARFKQGFTVREGEAVSDLLEGFDCRFRTVHRRWYESFVGRSLWFYEGDPFPMLQCVMPDKGHRFPWEDGFDRGWYGIQPWLWAGDVDVAATADHWREWMSDTRA